MSAHKEGLTLPRRGCWRDSQGSAPWQCLISVGSTLSEHKWSISRERRGHDAFAFLRGTCQLFCEDLRASDLPKSPLVWCCGDLHLENFSPYKGDNRLAYFDLNDFDEACLAPALWELVRFLTSIRVGGKTLGMDRRMTTTLMRAFLEGYAGALRGG